MKFERNQESLSGGKGACPALVTGRSPKDFSAPYRWGRATAAHQAAKPRTAVSSTLGPQANSVSLDLRVKRSGVHSQQPCGTRLMSAGLLQCTANEINFKAAHLIVEIDAASKI